jgi:hypothetical protein
MANHYVQFSEALNNLTEAERIWCTTRLQHLETVLPTYDEEGKDDHEQSCQPEDEPYLECAQLGFERKLQSETNGHSLWFYSESDGNAEHVALFAQEFLKRFRPENYFTLTWAMTCSKPHIGEFSGGAVFVTATEILWNGAYTWLTEKIVDFTDRQKSTALTFTPSN